MSLTSFYFMYFLCNAVKEVKGTDYQGQVLPEIGTPFVAFVLVSTHIFYFF